MVTRCNKNIYLLVCLLATLSIGFGSCVSDKLDIDLNDHKFTRAQFQINKLTSSGIHFESQVEEVRLLLFDIQTGACFINQKLTIEGQENLNRFQNKEILKFDWISVKPGRYDVLLLANENSSIADLSLYRKALGSIRNKADLQQDVFRKLPYVLGANRTYVPPKGPLLMSAYLSNVMIEGGTIEQPQPIKASLLAALTKVEVVIKNKLVKGLFTPTDKRIKHLSLKNIASYYSNPAMIDLMVSDAELVNINLPVTIAEEQYQQEHIGTYEFYIPELIREEKTSVFRAPSMLAVSGEGFVQSGFMFNDDLDVFKQYLTETNRLRIFQPHFSTLAFEEPSTNNLLRNMIYRITLNLTSNRKEIEADIEVLPWNEVKTEVSFEEPKWKAANFKLIKQSVNGSRQVLKSQVINLAKGDELYVEFTLDTPKGVQWQAKLANPDDFEFTPESQSSQVSGKLGQFGIRPKANTALGKETEFYLTVRGKELKLWQNSAGLGNRYIIKYK